MKIAIIIDGLALGGSERQAVVAAGALSRAGEDVELLNYGRANDYRDYIRAQGVRLVTIADRGFLRLARLRELTRYCRRRRLDVVHAFEKNSTIWTRWAAGRAGVPRIFGGSRGLTPEGRLQRRVLRLASRGMAGWIVNCQAVKESLVVELNLDPGSVRVVPNGLSAEEFRSPLSAAQARERLGIDPGAQVVTLIANLRPVKNPRLFVEAAAMLPKDLRATFVLAGEGPLRAELESVARQAGIADRVRLLGTVREIPDLLRASDVIVLCSRTEGLPNVLLEAGAAGLPCVATRVGGAGEVVVDGETGFLVPSGDAAALAGRVRALLEDPSLRRRMGLSAAQRVDRCYSPTVLAERLLEAYRSASGAPAEQAREPAP